MALKIIFAGTPEFAKIALAKLIKSEHEVIAVYTQPDKPKGRGQALSESPVKQLASLHNIPIYQPKTLKAETAQAELAALAADVMIVAAYGLILPKAVLAAPKWGCLNIHASLLPKYRGASPIQQALLKGDHKTGITIMQMDEGLDTGDILLMGAIDIANDETSGTLHDKLAILGGELLIQVLKLLEEGRISPEKQNNDEAVYAPKIQKEDAFIHWEQTAAHIERQIRAYQPWPIAFTSVGELPLKIHAAEVLFEKTSMKPGTIIRANALGIDVATGENSLRITQLQLPNGKILSAKAMLNGKGNLFLPQTQLGKHA